MYVGHPRRRRGARLLRHLDRARARRWRDSKTSRSRAPSPTRPASRIRQAELYQRAEADLRARGAHQPPEPRHPRLAQPARGDARRDARAGSARSRASRVYIRPYDPARPDDSPVDVRVPRAAASPRRRRQPASATRNPVGRLLIETQRTLVIDDARNYDGASPELDRAGARARATRNGGASKIFCPLVVQGRFRGALCIHQTDRAAPLGARRGRAGRVGRRAARHRHRAGRAVRDGRARQATWEATFDAMSDGIFIFVERPPLMRVNRAGAAMESAAPRELLGRRCCDILRSGRGEGCIVERATAEGRAVTLEYTPERLGRTLLVTAEPVCDEAGAGRHGLHGARPLGAAADRGASRASGSRFWSTSWRARARTSARCRPRGAPHVDATARARRCAATRRRRSSAGTSPSSSRSRERESARGALPPHARGRAADGRGCGFVERDGQVRYVVIGLRRRSSSTAARRACSPSRAT